MKYNYVNDQNEIVELRIDFVEDGVAMMIEVDESETPISTEDFISRVLTELSETDASPPQAVVAVTENLDSYSRWYLESEFSEEDVEIFKTYCNEQCGFSLTNEEALTTLRM